MSNRQLSLRIHFSPLIRFSLSLRSNLRCPDVLRGLLFLSAAAGLFAVLFLPSTALAATPAGRSAQEEVTREFQKTVTLAAGQTVSVDHRFGEVRVHPGSGRDVNIHATIRVQAGSQSDSQSFADKVQIEVEPSGDTLRIHTVYPEGEGHWFSLGRRTSYSVNYDISMPADAPLRVKNSFGSVDVNGIHGSAEFENGHGSVTVRDSGPARLTNSFGSVDLASAAGDVSITDNNGSVQAGDVKGSLEVRNRFGNIRARNIQGRATLYGGNGAIELSDAASANITDSFASVTVRNIRGDLTLRDNNGNVDIAMISGGADITNSFGSVTFTDVKGRVSCTTNNGRVKGSSIGGNDATIHDSFGNIELENVAGSLDAQTTNGKISVHDVRGEVRLTSSFGTVEAYGIPKGIRAVTGNGSIQLTDIGGDGYAKTSFGSVTIERVGGNLTVDNSNGSVTARNVKGDATVNTSFAGVTLESVGGRIRVDNQNGGISVSAARPGSGCRDISLRTSFSSIRVAIPAGIGYNVTAHTSFGRVSSELPITASGEVGGESLNGTIGSGGCALQLNDSNGSIEIVKAP